MTRKNTFITVTALMVASVLGGLISVTVFTNRMKSSMGLLQPASSPPPPAVVQTEAKKQLDKFQIALETYSGCSRILSEEQLSRIAKREIYSLGDTVLTPVMAEYKVRLEVVAGGCDNIAISFQVREMCGSRPDCLGEKVVYRNLAIVSIAYAQETVQRFIDEFDGAVLKWKREARN